MVYDLTVDDVKVKPHQVTTLHMICALAFLVGGTIAAVYNFDYLRWCGIGILACGIGLTGVVIAKNKWVISSTVNPAFRLMEMLVCATIAAYALYRGWKFPIVIFTSLTAFVTFAFFWERSARPLSIHLGDEGITLPATARRRFRPWTDIEEVILRFGILTINYVDNSLMQWPVPATGVDADSFEAWCAARVEAFRDKRQKEW
jgi:hypothetical protein